jgi:transcriptional regulator with XRE-family HTH domain
MPRQREEALLRQLGQRVAQARRDRGWSQEQLAEAIDIQPVTVSRWETGHRALSISTLARITDALGVSLGDLLDVERELPRLEHGPEEAELQRIFEQLTPTQRDLVLRLIRELADSAPPPPREGAGPVQGDEARGGVDEAVEAAPVQDEDAGSLD